MLAPYNTSVTDNLEEKGLLLLQEVFQKIKDMCVYQRGYF